MGKPLARKAAGNQWGFVFSVVMSGACAATPQGASPENVARAQNASPAGAALFKQHCAGCHGERGESASGAPRILGPGALPEYPKPRNINADPATGDPEFLRLQAQSRPAGAPWRDPFRTAQDLYKYVNQHMPDENAKLSAQDYWAIVNFMLLAHGVAVPPEGVTEENASSIEL